MKNCNVTKSPDGKRLTIEIDLTQDFGKSKSGKTNIVATTGGNVEVLPGVKLGINCYRDA